MTLEQFIALMQQRGFTKAEISVSPDNWCLHFSYPIPYGMDWPKVFGNGKTLAEAVAEADGDWHANRKRHEKQVLHERKRVKLNQERQLQKATEQLEVVQRAMRESQ